MSDGPTPDDFRAKVFRDREHTGDCRVSPLTGHLWIADYTSNSVIEITGATPPPGAAQYAVAIQVVTNGLAGPTRIAFNEIRTGQLSPAEALVQFDIESEELSRWWELFRLGGHGALMAGQVQKYRQKAGS